MEHSLATFKGYLHTYKKNFDVFCSLRKDKFTIDTDTGELKVVHALDREALTPNGNDIITLLVTAQDHGVPPLESTVLVHVVVNDENDNAPVFDTPSVTINITENTPVSQLTNIFVFKVFHLYCLNFISYYITYRTQIIRKEEA